MGNEINRDSAVYFDNVAAPRASTHRRRRRRRLCVSVLGISALLVLPPFPPRYLLFCVSLPGPSSYLPYLPGPSNRDRYARILRYDQRESSFRI